MMKENIIQYWNGGATGYNKGVQRLLHSQKENSGWKAVFSDYFQDKPLRVLNVGTGPGSMLLSERRNMWKRDMENNFVEGLWSTHANRPQDDCILFRNAGLVRVESSLDLNQRVMTFRDYLRQGHWGDTFLVTGIKPEMSEQ